MSFLDTISKVGKPIFGNSMDSFFHPENAYKKAQEEYSQQYERAKQESRGYIDPYNQNAQSQYGNLNQGINNLMNPEQLMNRFSSGYETSPYAKRMLQMNQGAGMDAASSMGIMGSSAALGNIQQGAGDIVGKERESYLKMMMAQYLEGLGLSQGIYNTGAGLAGNYASNLLGQGGTFAGNMGGMMFGQHNAPGQMFGGLLRNGMQAYGMGAGGGMGGGMGGGNSGGGGFLG